MFKLKLNYKKYGVKSFQSILFLAFKGNRISNILPAIFPNFGSQQKFLWEV